jgi:hypothetical protein
VGYKSKTDNKMNRTGKRAWVYLCLEKDPFEQTNIRLARSVISSGSGSWRGKIFWGWDCEVGAVGAISRGAKNPINNLHNAWSIL